MPQCASMPVRFLRFQAAIWFVWRVKSPIRWPITRRQNISMLFGGHHEHPVPILGRGFFNVILAAPGVGIGGAVLGQNFSRLFEFRERLLELPAPVKLETLHI